MNVTGDRQVEHGLSTVGYDDEGVAAQTWDIIRDGVLVGYQLSRQMARRQGFGRSNGCAFADAAERVPLQRMPNVSLRPSAKDITLDELIGAVDDGIYVVGDKSWSIDMQRYNFQFTGQKFFRIRGGRIDGPGQGRRVSVQNDRLLELDGGSWGTVDLRARRRVQLRQGPAEPDRARHARVPGRPVPSNQHSQHRAGGALIDIQETIERVLKLSKADACIVIGQRDATANVRWAHNSVTTNGVGEKVSLSVVSIVGRRVASVSRSHFPPEHLEAMVRESEAACERKPEAPDYMPLLDGDRTPSDWEAPWAEADIHVFDAFVPELGALFERARRSKVQTFGYAEHSASTVWLATSTGLRKRHGDRIGKVEVTAKTPDFSRSSWVGAATRDFRDVDPGALLDTLNQRLAWAERKIELPAGQYDVLLEPSCTADLALGAYFFMTRRDADEGRSPYAKATGGTRIGEQMFGSVTMYSDPNDPDILAAPFHCGVDSGGGTSVFDNGLAALRTDWVRGGELRALVTPRYWAAKVGAPGPVPYINNLIVPAMGQRWRR